MIKVLFVCHGNICRSPMAEFIMKDMLTKRGISDKFYIASAATSTEEIWNGVGNPVYPPAKKELAKHGISCEGKRAVQITRSDYGKYDYILGMEERNIRNILRIVGKDPEHKVKLLLENILKVLFTISRIDTIDMSSHIIYKGKYLFFKFFEIEIFPACDRTRSLWIH